MPEPGTTHIAGNCITVCGRYMRQRCAWCGGILIDIDLTMTATSDGLGPGGWVCGGLVTVDGNSSWRLEDDAQLPDNFCGREMFEVETVDVETCNACGARCIDKFDGLCLECYENRNSSWKL